MGEKNVFLLTKNSEDIKHYTSAIITNEIDVRKWYTIVSWSIQYGTPVSAPPFST